MKKILFCICCIFMCVGAFATPAVVGYIIDGDTFAAQVLLSDGIKISVRVRLRNIDTPEIHGQCEYERTMAHNAKIRLGELIPVGTIVELENIRDDKYLGRIDANVIMHDGRDVGRVLISEKYGRPYSGGKRQPWCKSEK